MTKHSKSKEILRFDLWIKMYGVIFGGYALYSLVFGYLYTISWNEELGINVFGIPQDSLKIQILGGLKFGFNNPRLWLFFVYPILLATTIWLLNEKIDRVKNWLSENKSVFVIPGIIVPIMVSAAVLVLLIRTPIALGKEKAKSFKCKANKDQIVLSSDSTIQCKIIHYTSTQAVFLIDSVSYSLKPRDDSYAIRNIE